MSDAPPEPVRRGGLALVTARPVAIGMLMLAIAVFGLVSLGKLPMDLLPEISYPTLTVRTTWPGSAPEDVEERVSMRIQEAVGTLPGLVRTQSISRAGVSDVLLEYQWGTRMPFAAAEVRDKLDSLFLPPGAERPLILRYDPNLDPILRLAVRPAARAGGGLGHARWVAENRIERDLESLPGVAAVSVQGGLEEEIRVLVDPQRLAAHSIDPAEIARRLAAENLNASGGMIREGSTDYLVRTLNEFRSVEEIAALPILRRGEAVVRLGDVAEVRSTHRKREVVTRLSGEEAVEVAVYREAGARIVDIARAVRERVLGTDAQREHTRDLLEKGSSGGRFEDRGKEDYLAWRLRGDVEVELLSDQSTFIRAAIRDVQQAALLGGLLAIAIIWLFLRRVSSTLIVGLSIPISVVVTFAPMYLLDVSLNIMSLGGLALGVGMLVDNAIVVLESIARCREEGDDLGTAAVRGVREVAGAVSASTLTTVSVFAPIVFVHGVAGQIFGDQAVTVVSGLLVSLLVALLFIPMLASRPWLAGAAPGSRPTLAAPALLRDLSWSWSRLVPNVLTLVGRVALALISLALVLVAALLVLLGKLLGLLLYPARRLFDVAWALGERGYQSVLRGSLAHPVPVLAVAATLGALAFQRVGKLGVELLPEIHQGEFTARVALGVESPLQRTDEVLRAIEREVRALPGVALTALTVGVEPQTLTREIEGEHTARLTVRLEPEFVGRPARERVVLEAVRGRILARPEVRGLDIARPTPFALAEPVAVEVRGHDLEVLGRVAEEVRARLAALPELVDVRSSLRPGHPEARVAFDRDKTLEYGLDLSAASNLVRDQLLGNVSTRFTRGDDRIDIRVLADEGVFSSLRDVLDLVVNPASPTPVPLGAVAQVELVQGPAEIRRIGGSRAVVVGAVAAGFDLGGVNRSVEAALADLRTPSDVVVELGGQKRELDEGLASMIFALLLAIFLVYVVMASQFESLLQPFVILLTVPLAAVGVVFGLDLLGVPLSVVVFIGLILLAGIVVNNAIVLVDRVNQQRARGLELRAALLEAGRARLRPILMTTATTALGLLPMTGWLAALPLVGELGSGEGAEIRAPMAITVITGLLASTLLTLVVIPTAYLVLERARARLVRRGGVPA